MAIDPSPAANRVAAPAAGPPTGLDVDGPAILEVGEIGDYVAAVTTTATVPITYTWELAGRHPIVVSKKAYTDTQSFSFGVEGTAYITVTVENTEGSSSLVRRIYVQEPPQPDLVARDLTYNGSTVTYYIRNDGDATVTETHTSRLYVDGTAGDTDEITVDMAPGVTLKRLIGNVPPCSGHEDEIALYVDRYGDVDESDEGNNSRVEVVRCDPTPPTITRPPFAYDITTTSALIRWETDEASDSEVYWGTRRGAFNYRDKISTPLVTSHALTLTGLTAGTTYEYKVISTDAAGNSVESRPATFETDALASPPPPTPTITVTKDLGHPGAYQVSASFTDASQVAHVEFFINDKPLGVDYGNRRPPGGTTTQSSVPVGPLAPQATAPVPTVVYEKAFVPLASGFTRDTFFEQNHTVTAVVQTWDRTTYAVPVTVNLPSTSEPLRVEAHIEAPDPDHTIYINGDTTPAGTIVPVEVFAARFDWDCEYGAYSTSADCEEVMRAVDYVNVYLGNDFITALYPTGDQDFDYEKQVALGGLPPGSHQIRVLIVDAEAGDVWLETFVEVVQRLPSLEVTREVDRFGNRIRVRLMVENLTGAAGLAKVMHVEDYVRGFQVARDHDSAYRVWAEYGLYGAELRRERHHHRLPRQPRRRQAARPGREPGARLLDGTHPLRGRRRLRDRPEAGGGAVPGALRELSYRGLRPRGTAPTDPWSPTPHTMRTT